MKIIFERNKILAAVTPMLGSVSSKNTIAAIEGIKITTAENSCELYAFDNEKGMKNTVEAEIIEPGSNVINANKLYQILRVLPDGAVTVDVNEKNVTVISVGVLSYKLHCLPGDDFPLLPDLNGNNGFRISCPKLGDMISRVMYAVAVNDPKPMLNGVFFKINGNKITTVSCDGNRLALRNKVCDIESVGDSVLNMEFIIPGKSLVELIKLLPDDEEKTVKITLGSKHVIFEIGNIMFFTRMIDSTYIEYERFIPKTNRIFAYVNSEDLICRLERAALVTEEKTVGQMKGTLKCSFRDGFLALSSSSVSGEFYDEIGIEKEGDDIDIGFNCKYFLDAMRSADSEEVKLSMSTPLMSMIIEPRDVDPDDNFIYLVLPSRMKQ